MTSKTFKATIVREGSLCLIPLPFDPKAVFGKIEDAKKPETRARRIAAAVTMVQRKAR
jgi:hypothetical protein